MLGMRPVGTAVGGPASPPQRPRRSRRVLLVVAVVVAVVAEPGVPAGGEEAPADARRARALPGDAGVDEPEGREQSRPGGGAPVEERLPGVAHGVGHGGSYGFGHGVSRRTPRR